MADPVVVGVDGSAESLDALEVAARLARQADAPVVALHVRHEGSLAAAGEIAASADAAIVEALEEAEVVARTQVSGRLAGTGLDWRFDAAEGDPAGELIRHAVEHGAAAIVVGGRAHGLIGGVLLGSVAQKLVRESPISVLVVRDGKAQRFSHTGGDSTEGLTRASA